MDLACLDGVTSGSDGKGWAMVVSSGESVLQFDCGVNDGQDGLYQFDNVGENQIQRADEG